MKKIVLNLILLCFVFTAKTQTVLNEVYVEPGGTNSEFIELYNSGAASQNVNCFTILTYWASGPNRGVYVIDLPNLSVASKGFFVGAAASPFTTQSTPSGTVPNFNWNDPNFRNGSTGGYLQKWQVNGAGWTNVTGSIPATLTDLLENVNNGGPTYTTLVYVNGVFNNGFIGGGANGTLATAITSMPNLSLTSGGGGCSNFIVNFSAIGAVEFVNSSPGTNNGYARTSDGKCGSWQKTSSSVNHTPGITNGSAAGLTGELVTAQQLNCNTFPSLTVSYNITGISGSATEVDDFPVEVQLYHDNTSSGTLGVLDGADIYQSSQFDATVADGTKSFTVPSLQPVILVYKTKRGCFDKVVAISNGCISLPVDLKVFTASRVNSSTVLLKWETSQEQNNRGFSIQRKDGNSDWQEVAFVASKAVNGSSSNEIAYQYTELNTSKTITQYRIRQVDLNDKSTYTEIRSVRGVDQKGGIILYPNPSNDGKINVVFEDRNATRDVTVTDMGGRTVKQFKGVSSNSIIIDNLVSGMYTLRVSIPATGEQIMEKIIVNRH